MYGLKRATQWGYSLYEMGVYGSQSGANTTKPATTYDSKGSITLSFDAGRTANWTSLNGLTTLPSGTSVSYEARTSTDDSTWSTWATVPTSGSLSSLTSNRYIQIEANLSSSVSTATPLLTQLSLGYSIPIASPTVSLSSSSTTLSAGSSTTLTWSSSNATGCTASGGWSGARAISGSAPVSPTATTTYSLSCTGNGGTTSATPITVTVSAPTAPDPSGQPVPVGNQPGWQQVFYDNFENENVSVGQFSNCSTSTFLCSGLPTNVQSKWWDYPDTWPDTSGNCEYYPSQTLSIASNVMNMYIHTASNGTCMTAVPEAKLPNSTDGSNGQLYGMYSVRMKSDPVAGYKTAFLLWPDSENWPQDGEIDFPEGDLDSTVGAHMHYQGATSGGDQDNYSTNTTYTDWHTYTTEWTPTSVEFLIDGQVIGDSTNAANIPDTPMHWVLQTESEIGAAKPASSASGNLQISWVSVWSYDPSTK
jgi:beta-glucanase (GH16 family)